jgi:hypothetical protein
MKKHFSYLYLVTVCFFVTTFALFGQNPSTHPSRKALLKIIDQNFIDAAQQYKDGAAGRTWDRNYVLIN